MLYRSSTSGCRFYSEEQSTGSRIDDGLPQFCLLWHHLLLSLLTDLYNYMNIKAHCVQLLHNESVTVSYSLPISASDIMQVIVRDVKGQK